ncbi:Predicted DNA-binding transcriptional regulator YafY, contains an HTH and WYL domains [Paenibacillus sp. ov031]|uniref:helix-turn-helix transcriptional regulator n=1 Tax=Paenibacillus sp. ov031 TaxID=1761879 RepID=UPI00091B4758|nr:WYL domain-containing protein [Paenibacillus sp. ov031]SHN84512.1 Predicted DNA-binding transcriptional regulator YafY, contains an HTH and WYL domains [Paenibacillus sp. ov031]
MSNMHRIHWFDEQIRSGRFPNSSWLAREFEISRRQAQRDIEYMAISLRAPLVYIAKYRGYCYEDQTYRLPHLYMTEEEQRVLKYLAHRYRHYNYDQSDAVKRVAHLLERFTLEEQQTGSSQFPVFKADPQQLQFFEILSNAIAESRKVHIHYRDHAGERQFTWCPLKMLSQFNADYVVGYEMDPLQQTAIRLEGMIHVQMTNETFQCQTDRLLGAWEEALPVRKPFVAEIRLKEVQQTELWQGYRIKEKQDQIHWIEFYDTDAFLQHLFISEWEELLSPSWLRRKLQQSAESIIDRLAVQHKANVN